MYAMGKLISLGCQTTTGGLVISGASGFKVNHMNVALEGDKATCNCNLPMCKKVGAIVALVPRKVEMSGKMLAQEGDMVDTGCGMCFLLPSSPHNVMLGPMPSPVTIGSGVNFGNNIKINMAAPSAGASVSPSAQAPSSEAESTNSKAQTTPKQNSTSSSESMSENSAESPKETSASLLSPQPSPSSEKEIAPENKSEIKETKEKAIHEQQGDNYLYYSSFSLAMHELRIKSLYDIEDKAAFLDKWKDIGEKIEPKQKLQIDMDKFNHILDGHKKIEIQWRDYKKATRQDTYRGDNLMLKESYSWLNSFIKKTLGTQKPVTKDLCIMIKSPIIMSTSKNPQVEYISKKTIFWHFTLMAGHGGITEHIDLTDEVTLPLFTNICIDTLYYIPAGYSYLGDKDKYGMSHKYVIKAKILPFSPPAKAKKNKTKSNNAEYFIHK
jgi:uncharacterized Zn-binding protein involved in type VI secretion